MELEPGNARAQRKLEQKAQRATVLSGWATVAALILSAGSVAYTAYEASRREEKEADTAAVQQYRSYLELLSRHPDLFSLDLKTTDVPGTVVLASAEALFHLTEHDPGWRKAVKYMFERHKSLLLKEEWDCSTFSERFMRFVRGKGESDANFNLRCEPGTDPPPG